MGAAFATVWNSTNNIIAEIFYCLIGVIFILVGTKALKDKGNPNRWFTAAFWFILALTFILGPELPKWVTGVCILVIAALSGLKKVCPSKSDVPTDEETHRNAKKLNFRVFIPVLCLAFVALLAATILPFGANNSIGISAVVSILVALLVTKAPAKSVVTDGVRLMDDVGSVGIFPQLLAALGALFTAAGVGTVISKGVAAIIPNGNMFIAVVVFCLGMFLFTFIMGNGFAAFSVITVGIGIPFLIAKGADPTVTCAVGITAGYCGTLCTPMAANFNIMPAALLETKDKYIVIKSQIAVALALLLVHILVIYFFAL